MNKLPWFPHDHDARTDEFIASAEDRFGHFGYAAYFKLLEIFHQHGIGDTLTMSITRLCWNLRSRWPQVRLYLDFCQTSGKVKFTSSLTEVQLQIPKLLERQSKMRLKNASKTPQKRLKHSTEVEVEVEVEVDKEKNKDLKRDAPLSKSTLDPEEKAKIKELKARFKDRFKPHDPDKWFFKQVQMLDRGSPPFEVYIRLFEKILESKAENPYSYCLETELLKIIWESWNLEQRQTDGNRYKMQPVGAIFRGMIP